ncbi:MAG: malonyl-ACP O-methyltransferase BioC [Culturomica sp.]|jgi:malonyl-ACP O-methyltransferase BioC|nr:malonyl-ACP O-methyltransferase BioC [Culturomica sp.]
MTDKTEIVRRFGRSKDSYDDNAYVQRIVVDRVGDLVKKFVPNKPLNVFEIGCGTGMLTKKLKKIPQVNKLLINDLVNDLCVKTAATNEIAEENIFVGDVEEIDLPPNPDLIISSSVFQWLSRPADTFKRLTAQLSCGGLLIFSTFGKENLKELTEITGNALTYPNRRELENYLENCSILYSGEEHHTIWFDNPLEILKHVKRTGVNAVGQKKQWTQGDLEQFVKSYQSCHVSSKGYPLTYHPIYIVAQKY